MSATALEVVRDWISKLDAGIDRLLPDFEKREGPVSCRSCVHSHCCNQKVFVHLFEAIPLAERLQRDGRDTPEFREKLRTAADAMDASTRRDWWQPCVFLEGGRCTIYQERPVACRAHFVISPAENCAKEVELKMTTLTVQAADQALRFGMQSATDMGLEPSRSKIYLHNLPRVVLRLLEAPRRNWQSYLRGLSWPTAKSLRGLMEGDVS